MRNLWMVLIATVLSGTAPISSRAQLTLPYAVGAFSSQTAGQNTGLDTIQFLGTSTQTVTLTSDVPTTLSIGSFQFDDRISTVPATYGPYQASQSATFTLAGTSSSDTQNLLRHYTDQVVLTGPTSGSEHTVDAPPTGQNPITTRFNLGINGYVDVTPVAISNPTLDDGGNKTVTGVDDAIVILPSPLPAAPIAALIGVGVFGAAIRRARCASG
jgi:hypothetical protein